jgi:hypothetical protein
MRTLETGVDVTVALLESAREGVRRRLRPTSAVSRIRAARMMRTALIIGSNVMMETTLFHKRDQRVDSVSGRVESIACNIELELPIGQHYLVESIFHSRCVWKELVSSRAREIGAEGVEETKTACSRVTIHSVWLFH